MVDLTGIVGIPFLKKSRFTGSDKGMCYMLEQQSENQEYCLAAEVWSGPYCYDKTPGEMKRKKIFALSEEGLTQAVQWINEQSQREEN